jgi:hypothetical protein
MKTSRYQKPNYTLTFGKDDVIFLDISLLVYEKSDIETGLTTYSAKIEKCFISAEMEFARHLVERLCPVCSAEIVEALMADIRKLLEDDISTSLHSLFYAGDIVPNE